VRGAGIVIVGLFVWPSLTVAVFIPDNQRSATTVTLRVVFDHDATAHLGQIALGIGNNDEAHASGISPDTVIAENDIYDIPGRIGLYLDEGSRYITVRENVVEGAGVWLTVNTLEANHLVAQGAWPAEARAVMDKAGIERDAGVPECGSVQ